MRFSQQLQQSTALTPAEQERRKTAQQRAEDVIYTLNHAVTCLSVTDFLIAPFFSSVFGWDICGHGHDHSKEGGHASHGVGGSASASGGHVHGPGCGHSHGGASNAGTSAGSESAGSVILGHVHGLDCGHPPVAGEGSGAPPTAGEPPASTKYTGATRISPEELARKNSQLSPEELKNKLEELLKADKKAPKDPRHGGFGKMLDMDEAAPPGTPALPSEQGAPILPSKPTTSLTVHYDYTPPAPPAPEGWWQKSKAWLETTYRKFYPNLREWIIGEAAGDLGAVPVTLAVQHFTPSVMTGIQRVLEPVVGGLLHKRAVHAAERWADKHAMARDAAEVVDRAEELYRYEIRHLPQMVMWTVASSAINYGVMRYRNENLLFSTFAKGKVTGAAITAGLVFGARTLVPDKAHQWDETMGRKLVLPVTKKVGRLFGIEARDVDEYHRRHTGEAPPRSWTEKVGSEPLAPAASFASLS